QILDLTRAAAAAAEDQLARSARAARRGDVPAGDAEAARIAAYDAADRLRNAERDLLAARQELARLLGLPPETLLALAPIDLPVSPLP
ncbi:hypothetical protein ABTM92_19650, partial [Acinetobacter baumannii]